MHRLLRVLNAAKQTNDLTTAMYCADVATLVAAWRMSENDAIAVLDLETITGVLGAVDRWREILSYPRSPRDRTEYRAIAQFLRKELGEEAFLQKWTEGQSVSMERVIDNAIRLIQTFAQPMKSEALPSVTKEAAIRLSERERQVLGLVAEGLSNQKIGERLFITERTVRFHVTSIFNKLGVENRAQAVAIANRLGIL